MASVLVRERPVAAFRPDFVAVALSWFAKVRAARRQRQALDSLWAMNAHMLSDLGINRGDLFDAAIADRPMHLLAERRARRSCE